MEWVFRRLPLKNGLGAEDARLVEEAFQEKLNSIVQSGSMDDEAPTDNAVQSPEIKTADVVRSIGGRIDKSVLAISEPTLQQQGTSHSAAR